MNVLVVDVGGNNVKLFQKGRRSRKFKSGSDLAPQQMVEQTLEKTDGWKYDVVAIGYPGPTSPEGPAAEPVNLGSGWIGFDFAAAFEKPVRIANDAALQALGSYHGGRMLFLGLGTAVGSTLIAENVVVSLELGALRLKGRKTIAELLGDTGLERVGLAKWRKLVRTAVLMLRDACLADDVVIGGGNAKHLRRLPQGMRRGQNRNVLPGGIRLWKDQAAAGSTNAGPLFRFV